ncbi:MAG: hypothetical protein IJ626_03100 [Muribaculaceae bacterium]|nr:hypothetical protein [Muribaculaceae bacterium]
MAKQEKELTVEERLKALYQLQTMLSDIDRIKTLRGELPLEVQDLDDEIARMETRVENYKVEQAEQKKELKDQAKIKAEAEAKIARYEKQQDDVRNNKEYEHLKKEIEFQQLNIELAEKKTNEATRAIERLKEEIEHTEATLKESRKELTDKRNELDEIIAETKQDEEKLRVKAKKLEDKFDDERLLTAFKRIRKNARNGLGIVYVQRNACGGCFNRIPAQRQSEIKMRKKIIVCEYCGRILVDPALAGVSEEDAKNE